MEVKERKKVESCKSIETKQQLRWESHKVFETDAPKPGTDQWKQVRFFKTQSRDPRTKTDRSLSESLNQKPDQDQQMFENFGPVRTGLSVDI